MAANLDPIRNPNPDCVNALLAGTSMRPILDASIRCSSEKDRRVLRRSVGDLAERNRALERYTPATYARFEAFVRMSESK
jgi:uridine kinase